MNGCPGSMVVNICIIDVSAPVDLVLLIINYVVK
jgi:hypothetical protein